jgi:gentisate 1,2-dioxygenase
MTVDATPGTTTETPDETELQELYRDLAAVDLQPLWTITEQLLTPTPRPRAVPWLWSERASGSRRSSGMALAWRWSETG